MVLPLNQQVIVRQFLKATKVLPTSNSELILSALGHSLSNLLVPLRQTTQSFLSSPRSSLEYNLYLQSISHIPFRTPESTHTVRSILEHVDRSSITITISTTTYTRLIRPSFTPVALLAYLHHRLTDLHHPHLPLPILLSFLTVYSKLSNPSKSSLFFSQIRAHPHTSPQTLQRANTLFLSSQSSQQAAYDVLISPPPPTSDANPFRSSASFHVLSKDLSIPSQELVQTFLRITSSLPNPPLVPLYTSLINGLILRKRYNRACVFFNKLLKLIRNSPLIQIDIPSLSAGINALTRAGHPHHAFQLLESHYPHLLLSNPSSYHNPILPLLTFLTALNRISRPDISTLLFFLYPTLYSPSSPPPNSHILNLLLQAARTGIKMDLRIQRGKTDLPDNLKHLLKYLHSRMKSREREGYPKSALNSILTKLNLRTSTFIQQITSSLGNNLGYEHLISKPLPPFGRQRTSPESDPRRHASNLILTHLGHPSRGGLRQFISSSAYQGIPTGTWARVVFLRVLAGVGTGMWGIETPAISFIPNLNPSEEEPRPSPNLDSFTHLFSQQKTRELIPYSPCHFYNPTLWENLQKTRTPFYPSIIPTNSNFFNYLILLGLSSHSHNNNTITLFPDGRVSQNENTTTNGTALLPPPSPLETPLVLAWMRTLSIQPSKSTLAIALVMWGEVCARVDAAASASLPFMGVGGGEGNNKRRMMKPGEGQYLVLVDYLREWVGEGRLPHWKTLEKWREVLGRMRGDGPEDLEGGGGKRRKEKYKRRL